MTLKDFSEDKRQELIDKCKSVSNNGWAKINAVSLVFYSIFKVDTPFGHSAEMHQIAKNLVDEIYCKYVYEKE